jgi:hypothetical protein
MHIWKHIIIFFQPKSFQFSESENIIVKESLKIKKTISYRHRLEPENNPVSRSGSVFETETETESKQSETFFQTDSETEINRSLVPVSKPENQRIRFQSMHTG